MAVPIASLSERISERFLVPRMFLRQVAARRRVDLLKLSLLQTADNGLDTCDKQGQQTKDIML